MGSYENFLITLLYQSEGTLLRCALQVRRSEIPEGVSEYPMEVASRAWLHEQLPLHVRNVGPIVDVDRIFAIAVQEER